MKNYLFYISLLPSSILFAQIQQGETNVNRNTDFEEESVTVERFYEPKIEAADKIKQSPEFDSISTEKLPVKYGLKDVKAESDFETSPIGAEELPLQSSDPFNNYVRFGIGNNKALLVDGFASYKLDEKRTAGVLFDVRKSLGNVKHTITNSESFNMAGEGFLKWDLENARTDFRIGGKRHHLNYYGIGSEVIDITDIQDVKQYYTNLYLSGEYSTIDHLFLDNIKVKAGYFGDKYDSSETSFDLSSGLYNNDIFNFDFLGDAQIGGKADINLNISDTKFEVDDESVFKFFNIGIKPAVLFGNETLNLAVGANVQYISESSYNDNSHTHIFPMAKFKYSGLPYFQLYGGLSGGLDVNRYQKLYEDVPYLYPNQHINVTKNNIEIFAGVTGDFGEGFKYNAEAKYQNIDNIPFFSRLNQATASYASYNSFKTFYDNGSRNSIEASLTYVGLDKLDLTSSVLFQSYKLDHMIKAWNKPSLLASVAAKYKLMNDRLLLGGTLFYTGKRKATAHETIDYVVLNSQDLASLTIVDRLQPNFDLNLSAHYTFLKQWIAFAEVENVLNNHYEYMLDYKTPGTTGIIGVMYKF